MKYQAIIYSCMALMAAAAVTGAAHYNAASKAGQLNTLYVEPQEPGPSHSKEMDWKEYSRAPLNYRHDEPVPDDRALKNEQPGEAVADAVPENPEKDVQASKIISKKQRTATNKSIHTKFFSRAPIDYPEPEEIAEEERNN